MTWFADFYKSEFSDPEKKNTSVMVIVIGFLVIIMYFFVI